jgi:hypothetical protein
MLAYYQRNDSVIIRVELWWWWCDIGEALETQPASWRFGMVIQQAIVTRYLGPTNFRGARIKASCVAGTHVQPWNYEWSTEENHSNAANQLQRNLEWWVSQYGELRGGCMKNGDYCWVMVLPAVSR